MVLSEVMLASFMSRFFFFNDPAPTEISTYGHPLALHDALPIWLRRPCVNATAGLPRARPRCDPSPRRRRQGRRTRPRTTPPPPPRRRATPNGGSCAQPVERPDLYRALARHQRSEEHTSELQSLMRSSYAVFCLKKKKKTKNQK